MQLLRALIVRHRDAAALLLAAALLARMLVPAGFMPAVNDGRMVIEICNNLGPSTIVIDVPGLEHKKTVQQGCAFADLSLPSLAGADPIQLTALIAFVIALGVAFAVALPPRTTVRLRPPLRGPPAQA